MGPGATIKTCLSKYAEFEDRATLPEFWWWTLLALIPFLGEAFLAAFLVFQGTKGANRFGPDPLRREATGPMPPMPNETMKSVAEWQDRP